MNIPMAVMLLIICTDGYQSCHVAHQAVQNYPSLAACEQDISKKIMNVSQDGQQIFGKCVAISKDFEKQNIRTEKQHASKVKPHSKKVQTIEWNVTKKGDLYTKIIKPL